MDPRDLRVGDADREHVAGLLQRAVGEGMLTLDEFSERMDTAMAARTRGELGAVVADLPGMQLSGAPVPLASGAGLAPLPLHATMSTIRRAGDWQAPELITVKSRLSDVHLDFTQADIRTPVVTIEIDDICGSIDITVPEDFTADVNGLRCSASTANSKIRPGPPAGRVHLVVRGKLWFSSLTVKHPLGTRVRNWLGR
ncbi:MULTISPECIES: DUF1707 SHOCT-like domain-containing protein [Mycolicibacterium]|nr:DUF1707 domain-containing protein [Mycolicibacterium chitae]MCV7108012.1 DUF1707 domain-containing protein [Mycolicibacterium chitae]